MYKVLVTGNTRLDIGALLCDHLAKSVDDIHKDVQLLALDKLLSKHVVAFAKQAGMRYYVEKLDWKNMSGKFVSPKTKTGFGKYNSYAVLNMHDKALCGADQVIIAWKSSHKSVKQLKQLAKQACDLEIKTTVIAVSIAVDDAHELEKLGCEVVPWQDVLDKVEKSL